MPERSTIKNVDSLVTSGLVFPFEFRERKRRIFSLVSLACKTMGERLGSSWSAYQWVSVHARTNGRSRYPWEYDTEFGNTLLRRNRTSLLASDLAMALAVGIMVSFRHIFQPSDPNQKSTKARKFPKSVGFGNRSIDVHIHGAGRIKWKLDWPLCSIPFRWGLHPFGHSSRF